MLFLNMAIFESIGRALADLGAFVRAAWSAIRRFLAKVRSLFNALWSLFWFGTVEARIYRERAMECFSCPALVEKKRRLYCGACGCPEWWLSQLPKKWQMLELKCPLGKW